MATTSAADSTSLLSKNVSINGEISGNENIKIEGFLKGLIILNGNVFVGGTGVVEADIEVTNIIIEGKVTGNIKAKSKLSIHPSGKLIGDVTARVIDIKEGAIFEGRSHMIPSGSTKSLSAHSADSRGRK
ncbi:MAG: hypothetical protein B6244_00975 [Candidatus Cloacimonetes bacterium 4572_55]|nr:MAG: hypothetical protein B6244_00975 [Candidatus Cloacimonetes bacterium 4572_55]